MICFTRPYKHALKRITDGFRLLISVEDGLKYRLPDEFVHGDPKFTCHVVGKELKTVAFENFAGIESFLKNADNLENCGSYQEKEHNFDFEFKFETIGTSNRETT